MAVTGRSWCAHGWCEQGLAGGGVAQSGRAQWKHKAHLQSAAALAGAGRGSSYGGVKGSEAQGTAEAGRGK